VSQTPTFTLRLVRENHVVRPGESSPRRHDDASVIGPKCPARSPSRVQSCSATGTRSTSRRHDEYRAKSCAP